VNKFLSVVVSLSLSMLLAACQKQDAPEATKAETAEAPAATLPAGVTLVDSYDAADSDIAIPYAKYRLDNGLTVILHEDHSDPLVHVDVTYHVGSNREEPGRSGFAHFFEHMMFQGSAHLADEEHIQIISSLGGSMNGSTNSDRTNYYETLPANHLETALWLEADRMGFLLEAVSEEKFEVQRETVKNERGQRVDNRPYGRVSETIGQHLYPAGHPYSWPVIGWIEDLDRADLDDLRRFFLRWYGPNNAALTIGGDIDPVATLALVNQYFGDIPRGPEVQTEEAQPAELAADRYVTLEDNIHLPAIAIEIPTVALGHPDEPALDAAAKIIGQGQASLLYQRLVQTGRAVQVSAYHGCRKLACEMSFTVFQNPASGETLAGMEDAVRKTLDEFAQRPVSEDDLQRFKVEYESNRVFGLQSVRGKVSTLAAFETYTGSPRGIAAEIERYLGVTAEDVKRVFEEYVVGEPAVILSIVPTGQTALQAAAPNHSVAQTDVEAPEAAEDEPTLRIVESSFDRSQRPDAPAIGAVELPAVMDARLDNGIRLLAVDNAETPTTTVRIVVDAGLRDEPAGAAGITALMGAMLGEATAERSAAEFAEALERTGASIRVDAGAYQTTVTLNVLSKHLQTAMDLAMESLLQPAFAEEDFERVKAQTLESLQQQRKTPRALAERAAGAVLYGPEHPLGFPQNGLPATVVNISLEELRDFYATHIPQHISAVLVSSDLPEDRLMPALAPLAALSVSRVERSPLGGTTPIRGRSLYLVDKEGAAQSSVRVVHPSIPYDALGDFYMAGLMNYNLGGNFNSRINLNLREDKGYTYGARSRFVGDEESGYFSVSSEVNKDATAASVTEILKEVEAYAAEGMTAAEYDFMQSAIGQRDALAFETPAAKLRLLEPIARYGLPLDYRRRQRFMLETAKRDALNQLALKLLKPGDLAVVVVGDAASLRPELEALEIPLTELDENGMPR